MDERSLRMLAEETGAPEWLCRLALEEGGGEEASGDRLVEDLLQADLPTCPLLRQPRAGKMSAR